MEFLIVLIVKIIVVLAIEEHIDYANYTSHATGDLRLKIPSQLDEVIREEVNVTNDIQIEPKGGALQEILSSVSFICNGRFEGYYSDTDFGCQIFHYCKRNGLRFTFVCPQKSIFNQKEMTCDPNISDPKSFCEESPQYYYLNSILYAQRKDVIYNPDIDLNSSEKRFNNSYKQKDNKVNKTRISTSQQSVILPINTAKMTTVSIRPFWGYNINKTKTFGINNKTTKSEPKPDSYSHHKLKLDQNYSHNNNQKNWLGIKNKIFKNDSPKHNNLIHSINSDPIQSAMVSTQPPKSNSGHTDWDDIETEDKLYKTQSKLEEFKPNLNEPSIPSFGLNSAYTAPLPLPSLPLSSLSLPSLNSGPMVVLRPAHIPGTLPITTLYKQTNYNMFGKPRVVHKGLYLNPTFGAALINPHSLLGSISPIGLNVAASQSAFSHIAPNYNSKLLSSLQNSLSKLSFSDIFSRKLSLNPAVPKQQRSDYFDAFNFKTTPSLQKTSLLSPNWPSKLLSKIPFYSSPKLPDNQKSQNNLFNGHEFYFPFKVDTFQFPEVNSTKNNNAAEYSTKQEFVHFLSPEFVTTPSPPSQSITTSKYSVQIEDTIDSINSEKPTIFFAINDHNIRNKWFEAYDKIKESYTERQQIQQPNNQLKTENIPNLANFQSNLGINKTESIVDKIIIFQI